VDYVDVLIVGAGLSGIGAAYHLQKHCPDRTYKIVEGREAIGGTWDLFRYPGIRSDSDMHTLGYRFKPWTEQKAIADGPNILRYVRATADENGITPNIQFNTHVEKAAWSSDTARWIVTLLNKETGDTQQIDCNFLYCCAGYYDYAEGHNPKFEGSEDFKGDIIHPQHWPENYDHAGKKVVVIGSGATAVTLVPEMAKTADHVTMLQRSPTYIISAPGEDKIANFMNKWLPLKFSYFLSRWRKVLMQLFFYNMTRWRPEGMKEFLLKQVREELGEDFDVEKHFTPTYNPWDQRLCLVPDSDLFESLKSGKSSVVTDHIERFTENGILLKSGETLDADAIVTATGLKLKMAGGITFTIDGAALSPSDTYNYKGSMFSDMPNFVSVFGYTNASWTLKADLVSEYVCRLLNFMKKKGYDQCTPRQRDENVVDEPFLDFSSGYVTRANDILPKQGDKTPWRLNQNYALDLMILRHKKIDDGVMEFKKSADLKTGEAA
jgi:cation diffusion facilitator CzcD-associated flavoprotein CzcO